MSNAVRAVLAVLLTLALALGVGYCIGSTDASGGPTDRQIDRGAKALREAYADSVAAFERERAALKASARILSQALAVSKREADSLRILRDARPLPVTVPGDCEPWALSLRDAIAETEALRASLTAADSLRSVDASTVAATDSLRHLAEARADSLDRLLQHRPRPRVDRFAAFVEPDAGLDGRDLVVRIGVGVQPKAGVWIEGYVEPRARELRVRGRVTF